GLATSDQRADGHETSVPGSKIRTEPKVTEQNISGVLHDSGSNLTELLFNARCAFLLGSLVERKERRRSVRKLIGSDLTLGKDVLGDRYRRHGIRPAGVKRKMRDDLRNLARFHAVVEREVDVVWHLDRLVERDQSCVVNDASITRCVDKSSHYICM